MIKLTLEEAARLTGGELQGDPAAGLEGAGSLAEAGPSDITFLSNPKLEDQLKTTRAGCVLLERSRKGEHPFAVIYVDDPKLAFAKVLSRLEAYVSPKLPSGIHPSAVVHPYAKIGKDVHVGPLVVVEAGAIVGDRAQLGAGSYVGHNAVLGADTKLYPHVVVRERCTLGERVIIHSGTVIGSDGYGYVPGSEGHRKVPQIGRVVIEDDVEIGANCAVDRATTGVTRIGRGTKIDNLVQVAHNVQIGRHCLLVGQCGVAGSTKLGDWVTVSGQAGVKEGVEVGAKAVIAAQAGIIGDVPAGAVYWGTPARPMRETMKTQALLGKLSEMYEAYKKSLKPASGKES